MERLGPTVDLYVQALIEENERLRHERDKFRQRHAMMRQKRNRWIEKHAERVAENRRLRRQLSYARREGEYRLKAAA
jgi:regulator of replication initiation timing